MKESFYRQKEKDGLPSKRWCIPHLLSIAILLFIPTIITIMPTEINNATTTRLSTASALVKRTLKKERLEQKKKHSEERNAEEEAKKSEDDCLLAEAIQSNDEWLAAQEGEKKKATSDTDLLMSEADTHNENINDHLSSLITPGEVRSPMKSKRKPNAQKSTTKQSSIRLSSKFSPEKQDHVYGFTLVLAAVATKGDDPVVQFFSSIKSLVKNIKTCLVNLYNRK